MTTATAYKPSTRKYCPTCGGKARDPQTNLTGSNLAIKDIAEDGTLVLEDGYTLEPCDELYHDKSDPDYEDD